jgi:hypothetical protein
LEDVRGIGLLQWHPDHFSPSHISLKARGLRKRLIGSHGAASSHASEKRGAFPLLSKKSKDELTDKGSAATTLIVLIIQIYF